MGHADRAAGPGRRLRPGSAVPGGDPGRTSAVFRFARPLGSFRLGPVSAHRRPRLFVHPLHRSPVPARQLVWHRRLGAVVPGAHLDPEPPRTLAAGGRDGAVVPVRLPDPAGALGPHRAGMDLLVAVLPGLRGVLPRHDLLLRPVPDLAAHVPLRPLPDSVHPAPLLARRTGRGTLRLGLRHRPVDRRRPARLGRIRRSRPGLLAGHGAHCRPCPRRVRCPARCLAVVGGGLERVFQDLGEIRRRSARSDHDLRDGLHRRSSSEVPAPGSELRLRPRDRAGADRLRRRARHRTGRVDRASATGE